MVNQPRVSKETKKGLLLKMKEQLENDGITIRQEKEKRSLSFNFKNLERIHKNHLDLIEFFTTIKYVQWNSRKVQTEIKLGYVDVVEELWS